MSHRRSDQFNSLPAENSSSKSKDSTDGAPYSKNTSASGTTAELCPACARVPVAEFLTPYEWADGPHSRPRLEFTDPSYLLPRIAERSSSCILCHLIAHAVHAGLAMQAGKPLPEASALTPADAIKAFFPIQPFGPEDFSTCRVWLRRGLNCHPIETPHKRYRVVYRIEVHLFYDHLTEAQFRRKSSRTATMFIQLMMDETEDEKVLLEPSTKTFNLGRTVPPKVRYSQIHNWLNICQGRHTVCTSARSQYDKGKYPERMRVVDIDNWMICDAPEGTPFVTLSYCWGRDQKYKLLDEYLNAWTKPNGLVAMKELPRTIRDSVTLVKDLGWR